MEKLLNFLGFESFGKETLQRISVKFSKNKYLLFLMYLTICALLFRINKQVRHYRDY